MSIRKDMDKLKKKETFSLHMPGHKGLRLPTDTTELKCTDNLLNPSGSIKELEEAISHIYDVKKAYVGTNGSTGLLMSSLLYAGKGKKIILPRGTHQSIYKGIIDQGQEPIYLKNKIDNLGIARPIQAKDYLEQIGKGEVAIFNNPTYEGYMEDYALLKPLLKDKTSILDGAHGSHLYYIHNSTNNWMSLQIHSLHKTLGAMNQGAVILSNLDVDFREYANFYQTSSPSFPILLSIEDSIREMMKMKIEDRLKRIQILKKNISQIKGFLVIDNDDPLKLLLTIDKNVDIGVLVDWLEEKRGVFFELSTDKYLLGILGFYDTPGNYEWFLKSLKLSSRHFNMSDEFICDEDGYDEVSVEEQHIPEMKILPGEAFFREKKAVSISESRGLVSGVLYSPYPPGAPLLVPGEIIDDLVIEKMLDYKGDYTGCSEIKDGIIFVIK
jgi:arginine decarboxylase